MGLLVAGGEGLMLLLLDVDPYLKSLAASALAAKIRDSLLLFPLLESIHVLGLALVLGTIAVVDLRLLGLASSRRPFGRIASDTFKWTWAAFALTAITGALMFTTNASVYYHNFYFRAKMLLLVLAAVNMLAFEVTAGRSIPRWENQPAAPAIGRTVGVISILIWISIIFMGRLIGFTTTRAAQVAPPPTANFDDFLNGAPGDPGGASSSPQK